MTDFDLYADTNGITVDYLALPSCGSLSLPGHIALDHQYMIESPERTVRLAHELGHCLTGTFHAFGADALTVARCERRADKWAVTHMVTPDEIKAAVRSGCDSLWAIADHIGITPEYAEKAISLYFP